MPSAASGPAFWPLRWLAAAIGVEANHPEVQPLIPDALEVGLASLRSRGHYPINHLIVVKDELLEAHPELSVDLFAAFAEAKRLYLARLTASDQVVLRRVVVLN